MSQEASGLARVRTECLDEAIRAMANGIIPTIPGVALLVWILGDSVPIANRLAWGAATIAASSSNLFTVWTYRRRRARGEQLTRFDRGHVTLFLEGAAWGSAAIIALPSEQHLELRAIYALFLCAVSSSNMVGTAAKRSYFYAFQAPLMTLAALTFVVDGDRVTRILGIAIPVYFATIVVLYHEINRKFVSEIELRYRNEDLLAEVQSTNDTLVAMIREDPLTGLANRTALDDMLARAVEGARRGNYYVGVVYFDLDRFKNVNDSLGHNAGDELLIAVARRVATTLRGHDVLARLGGDEFVAALDHLGDPYEAHLIAERIRASFAEPFDVVGRSVHMSSSIGVATNLHRGDGADELLRHADAAQYRAKEGGRNRIEVFDIELRTSLARRLDDERAVIDALAAGLIVPYFQPQVDLVTGRIVGAEALARWEHPELGVLGAPHFIPLAEETGLIAQIDDSIIVKAVRARVRLEELGFPSEFRIWCNVSPRQFSRVTPVERLARFLELTGCDARGLGLEITETAVLADMETAAGELAAARRLGVAVALDDFGTGHSSLTMLRHLPIDEVKIDQEFVRDLGVDPTDTTIVHHVAALANDLGLRVVAEGVQHVGQAAMLQRYGCHRGQGFLWSPAVPLDDLVELVRCASTPLGSR